MAVNLSSSEMPLTASDMALANPRSVLLDDWARMSPASVRLRQSRSVQEGEADCICLIAIGQSKLQVQPCPQRRKGVARTVALTSSLRL
jgi:hypothetical protein